MMKMKKHYLIVKMVMKEEIHNLSLIFEFIVP